MLYVQYMQSKAQMCGCSRREMSWENKIYQECLNIIEQMLRYYSDYVLK